MTVKTVLLKLGNLEEAVRWLSENDGEIVFSGNNVVIRCLGKADICSVEIVRHSIMDSIYIAIQRVYSAVRDDRFKKQASRKTRGVSINVTGKATKPSFVVRPTKSAAT